jgi:orotidine-5'-phosphate decarboxylase
MEMAQYWPFSGLARQGALRERLIVSLDMTDRREALRMVEQLGRFVGMFKVGRALFVGGGADLIREMRQRGAEIFLDLKFRDNSRNVIRAALEATRLGVRMFDIHPSGSADTLTRTRAEVGKICRAEGLRRPHILAVTMLASLRPGEASPSPSLCVDHLIEMARTAVEAGLDGVFTSLPEVHRVRSACGRKFTIATCGVHVRDESSGASNAMRAADAMRAGADYLVVGSRIWRSAEPIRAVRELTDDIERALRVSVPPAIEVTGTRPL